VKPIPGKTGTRYFILKIHLRFDAADQSPYAVGRRYDAWDNTVSSCGKNGPKPSSAVGCDAATQLRQTGHSCDVQHFELAIGCSSDEAAFRAGFILQISRTNMKAVARIIESRKMTTHLSLWITVPSYDAILYY
jgi:hypothetical protein